MSCLLISFLNPTTYHLSKISKLDPISISSQPSAFFFLPLLGLCTGHHSLSSTKFTKKIGWVPPYSTNGERTTFGFQMQDFDEICRYFYNSPCLVYIGVSWVASNVQITAFLRKLVKPASVICRATFLSSSIKIRLGTKSILLLAQPSLTLHRLTMPLFHLKNDYDGFRLLQCG